jgi:LemA protein
MLALTVVILMFFGAVGAGVVLYNSLVRKRNIYKNAFAQIDVQLQRRFDLIPNLVESVRAYMKHESQTLTHVIAARRGAQAALEQTKNTPITPKSLQKLSQANDTLNGALRQLAVVVENYPDLKASQNMLHLQEELSSTENKVAFARQAYNDAVMEYNTSLEIFPQNMLASVFGFERAAVFEIENTSAAKNAVPIQF